MPVIRKASQDPRRGPVRRRVHAFSWRDLSVATAQWCPTSAALQEIADGLVAEEIPTPRGGRWWASTVHAIAVNLRLDSDAAAAAKR